MDAAQFVRDAKKVKAYLKTMADGSVITTQGCKIYIPERYKLKRLMMQGAETYILAIYALVVEDKYYAVSMANAMIPLGPAQISTVKFDDEPYLELTFEAGSTVFTGTDLVKNNTLVYAIFDEFFSKAHVPWFIGYEDLAKLFDTADYHAGLNLGRSRAILEMIASMIARDPDNRTLYYRHVVKDKNTLQRHPPVVIPLRSVALGATNTTAKLIGAYADEGLTSALVNESTRVEPIEAILRL